MVTTSFDDRYGTANEKTEVLYGIENAVGKGVEFMAAVKHSMDLCYDQNAPSIVVEVDAYRNGYRGILQRGGKIRVITEVTKENLEYCKKLIQLVSELRHLDSVKGGLAVSENAYMATAATLEKGKPLTQVIYSNVRILVEQNQYLFDTLWNKAIPAEQKIAEIEKGIQPTRIDFISNQRESVERAFEIMRNAKDEVMVIFATPHIFELSMTLASSIYAQMMQKNENVKIRLLTPSAGEQTEKLAKIVLSENPKMQLRISDKDLQTRITILITDRKEVMIWEVQDDSTDDPYQASGIATYSNSESIASSYSAIFESLWKQTEMYEQLKYHDRAQQQFINIAAHELRTPIQPILMSAQALKRRMPENERIDIIARNTQRLQRLAENILDVARIESKTFKLNQELFNLDDTIRDVVSNIINDERPPENYESSNADNNQEKRYCYAIENRQVIFEPKDEPIMIHADPIRIFQVISNLLRNALLHSSQGGTIWISAKKDGDMAIVSVRDSGPGIAQDVFSDLFTKPSIKSGKGFGLGLYISRSIIEAHGGHIGAENKDKGATFWFSVPIKPPSIIASG
ncbi:MAG: HAMP domain-containing sensor histidine kinase [Thermoproteota archaeon]